MQTTSSLLASLVIMAALALVAILSHPGSANNVSANKCDWTRIDLTSYPKWLLVRLFGEDCQGVVSC